MKCAILVSLYNAEKTLDRTFESLRAQTWQDFRIIAIDDCSKDGTSVLLKKWQGQFGKEKFLLIDNEQNITNWKSRGVPSARLSAVALALGVSRDWLETGHGNMHGKPKGSAFAEERAGYALEPLQPWDNDTALDDV